MSTLQNSLEKKFSSQGKHNLVTTDDHFYTKLNLLPVIQPKNFRSPVNQMSQPGTFDLKAGCGTVRNTSIYGKQQQTRR